MSEPDEVWQALANRERRRIIDLLRTSTFTTGAIVEATGLDRFAVQRHLGVLRDAGLISVTARGRERHNALNASALYQGTIGWLRPIDRRHAGALDSLRGIAETALREEHMEEIRHLHVSQQIKIDAPASTCFAALTGDLSEWWGAPYLLLDTPQTRIIGGDHLGAIVREISPDREVAWGFVSEIAQDAVVGWTGRIALGSAASGTVRYKLTADDDGTIVDLDHESIGVFPAESLDSYATGWHDLLHRLKSLLEDGTRYGLAGKNCPPAGLPPLERTSQ